MMKMQTTKSLVILVSAALITTAARLFPIYRNFINSDMISVMGTIGAVYFCQLFGYAFTQCTFPGTYVLLFLPGTMMDIPESRVISVSEESAAPWMVIMAETSEIVFPLVLYVSGTSEVPDS